MVQRHTVWDLTIRALLTSAYLMSMVTQISGVLLIGWHTMKTPKVVNGGERPNPLRTIFFAFVESGSLALAVELAGIIVLYGDWWFDWIFIAVLAQVTVSMPLFVIGPVAQKIS